MKLSSGFAVNQALAASAVHNSLLPIKRRQWEGTKEIVKMRRRLMWTLTNSLRRTEDSTGPQRFCLHIWICRLALCTVLVQLQAARHSIRDVGSLARALAEQLQQERIETDVAYAWQHILCWTVWQ